MSSSRAITTYGVAERPRPLSVIQGRLRAEQARHLDLRGHVRDQEADAPWLSAIGMPNWAGDRRRVHAMLRSWTARAISRRRTFPLVVFGTPPAGTRRT